MRRAGALSSAQSPRLLSLRSAGEQRPSEHNPRALDHRVPSITQCLRRREVERRDPRSAPSGIAMSSRDRVDLVGQTAVLDRKAIFAIATNRNGSTGTILGATAT
jgi:hypothetical protein